MNYSQDFGKERERERGLCLNFDKNNWIKLVETSRKDVVLAFWLKPVTYNTYTQMRSCVKFSFLKESKQWSIHLVWTMVDHQYDTTWVVTPVGDFTATHWSSLFHWNLCDFVLVWQQCLDSKLSNTIQTLSWAWQMYWTLKALILLLLLTWLAVCCFCSQEINHVLSLWFLSLIHIWRCRRRGWCRSRWSPDH